MSGVETGLTQLMTAAGRGDADAAERLWHVVYHELRQIAHAQLRQEPQQSQLQTTVLVHEAYLRLTNRDGQLVPWENRRYFFAAAAEAMRRIRVDDARRRCRHKRGGGRSPGVLGGEPGVFDPDPTEVLAVNDVLDQLAERDPRKAEIVKLRYFAGLTIDDTATAVGLAPRTVDSEWRLARAWLHRALTSGSGCS